MFLCVNVAGLPNTSSENRMPPASATVRRTNPAAIWMQHTSRQSARYVEVLGERMIVACRVEKLPRMELCLHQGVVGVKPRRDSRRAGVKLGGARPARPCGDRLQRGDEGVRVNH